MRPITPSDPQAALGHDHTTTFWGPSPMFAQHRPRWPGVFSTADSRPLGLHEDARRPWRYPLGNLGSGHPKTPSPPEQCHLTETFGPPLSQRGGPGDGGCSVAILFCPDIPPPLLAGPAPHPQKSPRWNRWWKTRPATSAGAAQTWDSCPEMWSYGRDPVQPGGHLG